MNTELIPSEVANILRYTIKQNVDLSEKGHAPVAINIEGEAGLGKTSVVKQVCAENKTHHYIRLNLSEIEIGD